MTILQIIVILLILIGGIYFYFASNGPSEEKKYGRTGKGNLKWGKKEGLWEYYIDDRLIETKNFKNDKLHGELKDIVFNSKEYYRNGQLDGLRINTDYEKFFYFGGMIFFLERNLLHSRAGQFIDKTWKKQDFGDGIDIWARINGEYRESQGELSEGESYMLLLKLNKNRELESTSFTKNVYEGFPAGEWVHYDVTQEEATMTKFEGERLDYWEGNGPIRSREYYKNGKKEGIQEYYYDSGILEYRFNYKDGMPGGVWEWFSEDGEETHKVDWSELYSKVQ